MSRPVSSERANARWFHKKHYANNTFDVLSISCVAALEGVTYSRTQAASPSGLDIHVRDGAGEIETGAVDRANTGHRRRLNDRCRHPTLLFKISPGRGVRPIPLSLGPADGDSSVRLPLRRPTENIAAAQLTLANACGRDIGFASEGPRR